MKVKKIGHLLDGVEVAPQQLEELLAAAAVERQAVVLHAQHDADDGRLDVDERAPQQRLAEPAPQAQVRRQQRPALPRRPLTAAVTFALFVRIRPRSRKSFSVSFIGQFSRLPKTGKRSLKTR